ncbi:MULTISPECIES: nucleoside deaminase [unclassified Siphonobacter]|uniref:nucleoside deaminase n=1 Tax=unclassified Siphonobacter TaxID=2635712 RepID=UPI0027869EC2|nr:tRNA(adenine34) deaminase [Siphonobacter sp. SORGH_AS_1065]MDR6197082.1 tRNA(adenine34) deaminase [Siphonobacter sp. SORGH_AS_0500]
MTLSDEYFMAVAYELAQQAAEVGEIPVGAVVVSQNRIIGKGRNQTEELRDVTAHAEIIALTAASHYLGSKFLRDCTLYVTLEPCVMCAGALYWAQLGRLVYGASDLKRGFSQSGSLLHPKTRVTSGIMAAETEQQLLDFFRKLRRN